MAETLLSIAEVLLYGEAVADMKYKEKAGDPERFFVRVYGFSYEGGYYGMNAPVIMLLEGKGEPLAKSTPQGVKDSYSSDIRQWLCDKSDHSVRLDELTGSIEDILLEIEIGHDGHAGHVSGGRVSGGRVSGGRVSGGRVSGGRVSGGRVSDKGD